MAGPSLKITYRDAPLQEKLAKLQSLTTNLQPLYVVIGNVMLNRIRLCFKLGIDPWGSPWQAIKFRAPAVRMRAVKNFAGETIGHKESRDKKGNLVFTKKGKDQAAANASGNAGQPLRDTGRLNRSITSNASNSGVIVGTNVIYAPTHQFGATIVPKNGKRLVFPGATGNLIFAKKVVVPARPFLPLKRGVVQAVLPPTWSQAVVNAIKVYFRKGFKETA